MQEINSTQLTLLRNLITIPLIVGWMLLVHKTNVFKTSQFKGHLWRSFVAIIGMETGFYAVGNMPLNEATALGFTAPVFSVLLAIIFLNEKATFLRLGALAVGFCGMLFIVKPQQAEYHFVAGVALISAIASAIGSILIKSLTKLEHPDKIVLYQTLLMTPLALPAALYFWQPIPLVGLGWAVVVTLCAFMGQICMMRAFSLKEVVVLAPLDFLRLLFTALLSWWWFAETLDSWTALGAGFIIVASVMSSKQGEQAMKRMVGKVVRD
jgi:drug/metabolite transporter (DMT)-like permease